MLSSRTTVLVLATASLLCYSVDARGESAAVEEASEGCITCSALDWNEAMIVCEQLSDKGVNVFAKTGKFLTRYCGCCKRQDLQSSGTWGSRSRITDGSLDFFCQYKKGETTAANVQKWFEAHKNECAK